MLHYSTLIIEVTLYYIYVG